MQYFMGIDIGTYESKGVLVDEGANIVASFATPHTIEIPKEGFVEHDAETVWWADFCILSNKLISESKVDPKDIKAVSCSTIGPCCLPIDKLGNPLRKAILYGVDIRSTKQIDDLNNMYGKSHFLENYGSALTTQAIGPKILWVKENEPEIYKKTYMFIGGSTYLVAKLTGEYVIDHYSAATWLPLYDLEECGWENDSQYDICRVDQLATCKWTNEIVGTVTKEASLKTGLAVGTAVSTGTCDASAEAVGCGVAKNGDMMLMYGSSIFFILAVDMLKIDPRIWAGPYLYKGTYALYGGMSTTGTLTRWFGNNFAKDILNECKVSGENPYQVLMQECKNVKAGSDGIIVLPYLSGERTPINDPYAKGMIFGLKLRHTRADIYNACFEGVGYGINQNIKVFDEIGINIQNIYSVGGGIKNEHWLQVVSDICNKSQVIGTNIFGASYGDALLAMFSCGRFSSVDEMNSVLKYGKTILPNIENLKIYEKLSKIYEKLYLLNKDLMKEITL